jgi:hypothetical protein
MLSCASRPPSTCTAPRRLCSARSSVGRGRGAALRTAGFSVSGLSASARRRARGELSAWLRVSSTCLHAQVASLAVAQSGIASSRLMKQLPVSLPCCPADACVARTGRQVQAASAAIAQTGAKLQARPPCVSPPALIAPRIWCLFQEVNAEPCYILLRALYYRTQSQWLLLWQRPLTVWGHGCGGLASGSIRHPEQFPSHVRPLSRPACEQTSQLREGLMSILDATRLRQAKAPRAAAGLRALGPRAGGRGGSGARAPEGAGARAAGRARARPRARGARAALWDTPYRNPLLVCMSPLSRMQDAAAPGLW